MSSRAPESVERSSGPRSRKGARTRERLVEAAKEIFEEDGFLDARISDIARRAGLSHGSFYYYFDSKEEVFREVAAAVDEELSAPLADVIRAPSSGVHPRARIRDALRRYFERYRAEARIMGVIEQMSRYDAEVNRIRLDRHRDYTEQIADSIRQMQLRRRTDPGLDPLIAAATIGALTSRFAETWLVEGTVDATLEECVEQVSRVVGNVLRLPE